MTISQLMARAFDELPGFFKVPRPLEFLSVVSEEAIFSARLPLLIGNGKKEACS
jgi:hypothetical protein